MDADGLALLIWTGLFGIVFLLTALAVEHILNHPTRKWVRKLRALERARCDWAARCAADQNFWKDKP
jgi:hypothetical protein